MYDFSEIIFDAAKNYWNISKIKKNNGTSFYQFLKLVRVKKKYFLNFCDISWFFSPVKMCAFIFLFLRGLHKNHSGMPGAALGTLKMVPKLAIRDDDAAALILPENSRELTTFHFGFWTFMQFMGEKICIFLHVFGYNSGINHSIMISNTSN